MDPLITLADFAGYEDITSNLDVANRLTPYILQSQKYDLRGMLADALFWDFVSNLPLTPQTSGVLTVGKVYIVQTYALGDDFTNVANLLVAGVGPNVNSNGSIFMATGTTPTAWGASSSLVSIYYNLLNGCTYIIPGTNPQVTIVYEGLKQVLIHWTMARFYSHNNVTITTNGVVQKKDEWSEPLKQAKETQIIGQERNMAAAEAETISKYLTYNAAQYPFFRRKVPAAQGAHKIDDVDPYGGGNRNNSRILPPFGGGGYRY